MHDAGLPAGVTMTSLDAGGARQELKEVLGLTGAEISSNQMAPDAAVPFVHRHRQNEEIYLVRRGSGQFWLDGRIINLIPGDCLRVAPETSRCLRAGPDGLDYLCIQVAAGSLQAWTREDGYLTDEQPVWA